MRVRETGTGTTMTKGVSYLLSVCAAMLAGLSLAHGTQKGVRGHVNVSSEHCTFNDAVYVYDTPRTQTQKSVGALQDGAKVTIAPTPRLRTYYLVDGEDFYGEHIHGYVEKGCVTVDEEEVEELPPPPPPPPPTLRSGLVTVYPLDLGEKYEVTIGEKSGECTASSTKELSCKGLPDFQAIIASQAGHEYLLGCQEDGYETCVDLPPATYRITVHGRSVTVWHSGMERVNSRTGKKIGNITPVFSILVFVK